MNAYVRLQDTEFFIAEKNKYPKWGDPKLRDVIELSPARRRVEVDTALGVCYGNRTMRRRVLDAARAGGASIPDDASITTRVVLGFEYDVTEFDNYRERRVSRPQLYMVWGKRRIDWVEGRHGKSRLQQYIESQTFGMAFEEHIDECFEAHTVEGSTDLGVSGMEGGVDAYLRRILENLTSPPTSAPAFPTPFQSEVISHWRRDDYDGDEFEHILAEAVECMEVLGLDPVAESVRWETYPKSFAIKLDVATLGELLRGAQSDHVDAVAAQYRHHAEDFAAYRKELLTPQTMLALCVPLYRDAFDNVGLTIGPSHSTRNASMSYDYDADITGEPTSEEDTRCDEMAKRVMGDVEDAIEELCGRFAKRIEDHHSYITSDEGVWENAEGCGDFDEGFSRFINRD